LTCRAHLRPQLGIIEEPRDGGGQFLRCVGWHEQAFATTPDDALVPMDVRGDDGRPSGHGLEQDDPERFAAGRRGGEDIDRPEELGLLGVRHPTEELHGLETACRHIAARLALLRSRSDDEEAILVAGPAEDAVRLEQVEQALARLEATDEQDVRSAVLPARDRHSPGETRDIHAVGDHLVVAREEAVDEMSRGRADRDPAVEAGRVALHDPTAEFVRGGKSGVGVERRHIHAVRFAQEEERQERDERLVQVKHVKALTGEQVPDLAEVARREGQGPHGAVQRHAETDPDAQDVALRGALRSVACGDDPDIVTAQA